MVDTPQSAPSGRAAQIAARFNVSFKAHQQLLKCGGELGKAVELIVSAIREQNPVFILGDHRMSFLAEHLAAEFGGRFGSESGPLPVVALTEDSRMLAMVGNDYGSRHIYCRQVATFVRKGDILVVLAESLKPPYMRDVIRLAAQRKAIVLTISGDIDDETRKLTDYAIIAPRPDSLIMEEALLILGHVLYAGVFLSFQKTKEEKPAPPEEEEEEKEAMIQFDCPFCGGSMSVLKRFAGRTGVCPHCEMNMTIPAPDEPEKAAAAEPRRRIRFGLKDYKLQVAILGVGNRPFVIKPDSLVLENLSVDGIMFCIVAKGSESRPRLKIGGRVQVTLETPAFDSPIEAEAEVKRVEPIPDGRVGTVVGARFLSYRGDSRQKLERLEASPSLRKRAGQPEPVGAP